MEESQVKELRRRMKGRMSQELYEDESIFIRFLRARSHNIDAAETMLKNHIKWRIEHKVNSILTDFTPHKFTTSEYFPLSRLGIDFEDAPVSFMNFGNWDFKGMCKSVKSIDVQLYIASYLEAKLAAMKENSAKTGKLVDKWIFILDFENFSLASATHKPTLDIFSAVISVYEANFPERLKVAYIINNADLRSIYKKNVKSKLDVFSNRSTLACDIKQSASYYFSIFWAVLKPFFSPPTVKKIKIFGKTGWQEVLLQTISPEVLPAFLGGNRTDPDGNPLCKTVLKHGGPVPETFFQFANQTCAVRLPGAKKLNVSRMSKSEVTFQVFQPSSTLEWEFVLKSRDIGFSIRYIEDDSERVKEAIPQQRIETSEATESGMYKCEKAGTYIIEFDNTYSWLHSKEIYYTASVVKYQNQASSE